VVLPEFMHSATIRNSIDAGVKQRREINVRYLI